MPADAVPITDGLLRDWPLPGPTGGGKQARGQVLVAGGSRQTPGAVVLAAVAALRAGAGKLQIATVASVSAPLAVAVPEAMVIGLPETPDGAVAGTAGDELATYVERARAVGVGCGASDPDATTELVAGIAEVAARVGREEGRPPTLVVDALGLAALGKHPDLLRPLDGRAVLTPNPKELAILLDIEEDDVRENPVGHAGAAARRHGAVVALGGDASVVATPDGSCWIDSTGGFGLGVSGSGDAFAGVVTGLAARGAEPAQAAGWGAHLHGRAGDRLAARVGRLGYLAREVVDEVPYVLTELEA
jgi:hydroxyethylthiazole kinase-like uncharacterized protein yjeF